MYSFYFFQQTRTNNSDLFSDLKQPPMKETATLSTLSYKEQTLRMGTLDRDNYQAKFKLLLLIEEQTHQRILQEKYVNRHCFQCYNNVWFVNVNSLYMQLLTSAILIVMQNKYSIGSQPFSQPHDLQ